MQRPVGFLLPDIQAVKQPGQLSVTDGYGCSVFIRPEIFLGLQALHPEAKSVAIPVQDLDRCPFPVTKSKQISGKRVQLHLVFHQYGKTIDGFSQVGCSWSQIDFQVVPEHQRVSSMSISLDRVSQLKPTSRRTSKLLLNDNETPLGKDKLPGEVSG